MLYHRKYEGHEGHEGHDKNISMMWRGHMKKKNINNNKRKKRKEKIHIHVSRSISTGKTQDKLSKDGLVFVSTCVEAEP